MELVVRKNELAATYVCVQFVCQTLPHLPESVEHRGLEPHVPSGESNPHDSYAVIVVKGKQTVGHMPQKISFLCSLVLGRVALLAAT